ncbi:MAG TPA: M48 family metalloprotease [Armatimonadota bacterium]|jgi:predicted Zn-dependent protease
MLINHSRILAVVVLAGLATGCSSSSSLFKPSVADQKKLGDQAAVDLEKQSKMVAGPRLARVEHVGQRLVNALPSNDRKTWDFRFHVIDSKEVNAFALPGGNMFIYTGLLDRIKTDDELAAVMGHEMTHVRKEHWANMAAKDQERSAGLGILLGVTRASRDWYNVAGVANSLVNLRYSRKDEDQADEGGLNNMVAAGYRPSGMLDLFHTLEVAAREGSTPTFLRDHPLTSTRIAKTKQRIARMNR